jgi:hypothetical protein
MVAQAHLRPVTEGMHAKESSPATLSQQGRGSNWLHASLAVVETSRCGFGVITIDPIAAGTLVVMFGGSVITSSEFEELSHEMHNFPFQISDNLFLGPRDAGDIGIGERINHSCDPNVGFAGAIALLALRDIAAGDEITMDYATCVASNDDAFVMQCACGAPSCRKTITGQDWELPDVQARLLPNYQPFLQEKVRALRGEGTSMRRFPLSSVQNHDLLEKRANRQSLSQALCDVPGRIGRFLRESLQQEWMAIPICIIAGIPSTLVTTAIMSVVAPWIRNFDFAQGDAAFISTISLMSSVVGYATYLIAYYSGMLWKERSEWLVRGQISRGGLRRKFKVIQYDFFAHLPSDFWVMPLMGAATGGFFVAGLSQFWSILFAHTLADVAYAIKEPFFWHGAKKLVAWQESRRELSTTTELDRIAS